MKSYTWIYNDDVVVRFSTNQALIRRPGRPSVRVKFTQPKFTQPNEEHLGLYNAKLTADRLVELGYDCGGRKVLAIKSMRENVPFPVVLSEIQARRESDFAPRTINGHYLIQIPLAQDYQRVISFMRENEIKWR